ncbi:MAG TPA: hypothetical protein VGO62_11420, partial [Myxococcota bacterium]
MALTTTPTASTPLSVVRFARADLSVLDRDGSGAITSHDIDPHALAKLTGVDADGSAVDVVVSSAAVDVGRLARIYSHAEKAGVDGAHPAFVDVPRWLLTETAPERALLCADSYAPFLRTTEIPAVLDALLAHPDPKIGVFSGGLAGRTFGVVGADQKTLEHRTATYDGSKAFLYVPATAPEAKALVAAQKSDPKYENIEIRVVTPDQLASRDERLAMRFDRPGMFYVSSQCPVLPQYTDAGYVVPGGRFGMELYYHDARINAPSAHNTVTQALARGDASGAEQA